MSGSKTNNPQDGENSGSRGNSPERWSIFLEFLSERLQMGLLEKLKRIKAYHFEGNTLFIQPGSEEDFHYLSKDTVFTQLQLLAQDECKVERVVVNMDASNVQ